MNVLGGQLGYADVERGVHEGGFADQCLTSCTLVAGDGQSAGSRPGSVNDIRVGRVSVRDSAASGGSQGRSNAIGGLRKAQVEQIGVSRRTDGEETLTGGIGLDQAFPSRHDERRWRSGFALLATGIVNEAIRHQRASVFGREV